MLVTFSLFSFYVRYINIQLVEWVILPIAYIDDSYHLEDDICMYTTTVKLAARAHARGIETV